MMSKPSLMSVAFLLISICSTLSRETNKLNMNKFTKLYKWKTDILVVVAGSLSCYEYHLPYK